MDNSLRQFTARAAPRQESVPYTFPIFMEPLHLLRMFCCDTLWPTNIALENHSFIFFLRKINSEWSVFHSYLSLPEAIWWFPKRRVPLLMDGL